VLLILKWAGDRAEE